MIVTQIVLTEGGKYPPESGDQGLKNVRKQSYKESLIFPFIFVTFCLQN